MLFLKYFGFDVTHCLERRFDEHNGLNVIDEEISGEDVVDQKSPKAEECADRHWRISAWLGPRVEPPLLGLRVDRLKKAKARAEQGSETVFSSYCVPKLFVFQF